NRLAAAAPVPVETGLFQLLQLASRITLETAGAFDVTAGALIKAWGFYKGPRCVPSHEEIAAALDRVGMSDVILDENRRTVQFKRHGLEINLGSIGKGFALDRLVDSLGELASLPSVLLHGGYSSVYAVGNAPGDLRGWPIVIRHPWDPDRKL